MPHHLNQGMGGPDGYPRPRLPAPSATLRQHPTAISGSCSFHTPTPSRSATAIKPGSYCSSAGSSASEYPLILMHMTIKFFRVPSSIINSPPPKAEAFFSILCSHSFKSSAVFTALLGRSSGSALAVSASMRECNVYWAQPEESDVSAETRTIIKYVFMRLQCVG